MGWIGNEGTPRYVAYAAAHGRGVEDQFEHDRGLLHRYMTWINARWREWENENGRTADSGHTEADHAAFDVWLAEQVEVVSDGV